VCEWTDHRNKHHKILQIFDLTNERKSQFPATDVLCIQNYDKRCKSSGKALHYGSFYILVQHIDNYTNIKKWLPRNEQDVEITQLVLFCRNKVKDSKLHTTISKMCKFADAVYCLADDC